MLRSLLVTIVMSFRAFSSQSHISSRWYRKVLTTLSSTDSSVATASQARRRPLLRFVSRSYATIPSAMAGP